MNIEQTIKKQSLALLAKDNWGNAIGGFLIAVLPTVLLMILDEVISNIINLFVNTNTLFYQGVLSFISLVLVVVWLFSTPIFTGYFRMCYLISKNQDYSLKDIFYYFNKEKYNKCLSLNLNIMVRILAYFMVFTVPALIFSVFFAITSYVALLAFAITFTVMAFVATIFVCIKYTIVPCVYFEDESISNEEIIKLGLNFISDKSAYLIFFRVNTSIKYIIIDNIILLKNNMDGIIFLKVSVIFCKLIESLFVDSNKPF